MWMKLILAWAIASVVLGLCMGQLMHHSDPDR